VQKEEVRLNGQQQLLLEAVRKLARTWPHVLFGRGTTVVLGFGATNALNGHCQMQMQLED
jgi:hypothetical protein